MTLSLRDIRISLPTDDIHVRPSAGGGVERLLVQIDELNVKKGEAVTVMGASGSGKSSLLSYLCGVLDNVFMTQGKIFLDGEDVTALPPHKRRLGILFQSPLLFSHVTIGDNLAFGIPAEVPASERLAQVQTALEIAELPDYGDSFPSILSGGEAARIALLRVLLSQPKALLLDEPFSSLDSNLRDNFRQFVLAEAGRLGLPVLLVTHDKEDAMAFGNEILKIGESGVK